MGPESYLEIVAFYKSFFHGTYLLDPAGYNTWYGLGNIEIRQPWTMSLGSKAMSIGILWLWKTG